MQDFPVYFLSGSAKPKPVGWDREYKEYTFLNGE